MKDKLGDLFVMLMEASHNRRWWWMLFVTADLHTVDSYMSELLVIKATPTIVAEAFIFYLWTFFLQRTDTAARRRSGAPSKVYQWLGPRCRQKVTRKNFANRPPPNFYRGQKLRNLASILKISRLWRALVSKQSNISEI